MSASDTLEVGLALAQRAFENHRNASRTENAALYHTAVANYSRAIEMLSLSSSSSLDADGKKFLHDKIESCHARRAALEDYLKTSAAGAPLSGTSSVTTTQGRGDEQKAKQDMLRDVLTRFKISREENEGLPLLDDVVGLENAKDVLREATVFPRHFPEWFKTNRAWKTVLLYGPSGVGKTYLTKAIARESNSGLVCLGAGELVGLCDGKCESFVAELFECVKRCGRVILCVEDVDVIFSRGASADNLGLARVKAQVLRELEKVREGSDEVVFVGTTRSPWALEEGFLGRMDRSVHTGMPDSEKRGKILGQLVREVDHTLTSEDIERVAIECETYSAGDLKGVVMDAKLEGLRVVQDSRHFRNVLVERNGKTVRMMSACSGDEDCAIEMRFTKVRENMVYVAAVSYLDFEVACDRIRPTVREETIQRHVEFSKGNR